MVRHREYRPKAPIPAGAARSAPTDLGHVDRDGLVHRLYSSLAPDERHAVIDEIGLKHSQRIGHRHKVPELRALTDFATQWTVVDEWLTAPDGAEGDRAVGDLFDPLLRSLIERGRELLGEHADDPTVEQLTAMADALASERSAVDARLLLATVVELDFIAAAAARDVAASDPRFALDT